MTLEMNVTPEHVKNLVIPDGHTFDMHTWGRRTECGTVGCLWGTAYLVANGETTRVGPSFEWLQQSPWHEGIGKVFDMRNLTLDQALLFARAVGENGLLNLAGADLAKIELAWANLAGANLAGANLCLADLACADLAGASLTFACLSYARLHRANLAGANLDGADLTGAIR